MPTKWCCLPFANQLRCLPFTLKLSSSSIYLKIEVVIHFAKNWGRHPFCQKLKSRLKLNSAQQSWGLGWAWQYIVKDTKLYTENTEKITYSWFYKGSVNKPILCLATLQTKNNGQRTKRKDSGQKTEDRGPIRLVMADSGLPFKPSQTFSHRHSKHYDRRYHKC